MNIEHIPKPAVIGLLSILPVLDVLTITLPHITNAANPQLPVGI